VSIERMGEKSASNLLKAIDSSRSNPLSKLLSALGIRLVGSRAAQILAEAYGSMARLEAASLEELSALEGIGPKIAASVVSFFRDPQNRAMLEKLGKAGLRMEEPSRPQVLIPDSPLKGKKVVFTGELSAMPRTRAQALVRERGGIPVDHVGASVDFVVLGENPGSKADKARRLGLKILDENRFLQLLEGRPGSEKEEA
jgi:DNA ligase (NAD+)